MITCAILLLCVLRVIIILNHADLSRSSRVYELFTRLHNIILVLWPGSVWCSQLSFYPRGPQPSKIADKISKSSLFATDFKISIEILRFQSISRFLSRFQDFYWDFKILIEISRFQDRYTYIWCCFVVSELQTEIHDVKLFAAKLELVN